MNGSVVKSYKQSGCTPQTAAGQQNTLGDVTGMGACLRLFPLVTDLTRPSSLLFFHVFHGSNLRGKTYQIQVMKSNGQAALSAVHELL